MRDSVCYVSKGRAAAVRRPTQAGEVFGSFFPKDRQWVGLAEIVSTKLNQALTALIAPESLGLLHAKIQLLDGRLHVTARDRKRRTQCLDFPLQNRWRRS